MDGATGLAKSQTHPVVDLADVGPAMGATAGGKAANLGALLTAGLPAPPGFCPTTALYDRAAEAAGLGPVLEAMAARWRPGLALARNRRLGSRRARGAGGAAGGAAGARVVGARVVGSGSRPGGQHTTPVGRRFLTAGGFVVEMGGAMSHGAVVAREYGLPAVVGVPDATTWIRTGETIAVDGAAGTVTTAPTPPSGVDPAACVS